MVRPFVCILMLLGVGFIPPDNVSAQGQPQPAFGSLPPRWGAVQNGSATGNFGSGHNSMPSTGALSALGNALQQWINQGQGGPLLPIQPGQQPFGNPQGQFGNQPQGQSQPPGQFPTQPQAQPIGRGLKVQKGAGVLPNDRGQVWREYDLTPYTSRVQNQQRPEQIILDWILRETGTELWFTEPLGILNADSRTLRVYHTPEIQEIVRGVVERFVDSDAEQHTVGLKLVTISTPAWRSRVLPLLTPVDIQSPGVEAWLISKENAALLYGELKQRADFRESAVPNFYVQNAFTQNFGRTRPRMFPRSVRLRNDAYPGFEVVNGQLEEGFHLQVSPLVSADGRVCDVALKCHIDQVEKMIPVSLDVPTAGQVQRVQLQIPQVVSWRLNERFRWPADQVLLLSCGVVANPEPQAASAFSGALPILQSGNRSDALLFVEDWGRAQPLNVNPSVTNLPGVRSRY